jgi:hypothetical protein
MQSLVGEVSDHAVMALRQIMTWPHLPGMTQFDPLLTWATDGLSPNGRISFRWRRLPTNYSNSKVS